MKNNYCFPHLLSVQPITYPTPPYMSIRREGIEMFQLPVTQRKLMDMIKKFDPNDISYIDDKPLRFAQKTDITSIRDQLSKYFVIKGGNVWARSLQGGNEQDNSYIDDKPLRFAQKTDITSIRDQLSKYFVIKGGNVWARSLQGGNEQAKFKVKVYIGLNRRRQPITLQVQNQDLFLSYQPNANRLLKVLPLGQRNLDITNPETKQFFFNIVEVANKKFSLEPVTEPDWFISTAPDSSPVTVEPSSDQTHYMSFAFDVNFDIGYVSGSRFIPDTEDTSKDDTSFYSYNDRIVQDRYQSFLAREGYLMDVSSLGLDNPYRRRRQDNQHQSNYLGWH
ncbi:uncharacterized protein [Phyllobates terribilis]|uniref:uncharacterized protein n=1 Tax=Phyllobates terribilis TaxID=111132 RepID=UPI003CCA7BE5